MSQFEFIDVGLLAVIVAMIVMMVLYGVISSYYGNRKLRRELDERFGRIPSCSYKPETVPQYWKLRQQHEPSEDCIDEQTWDDLDMDRIFARINSCHTSIGDKYLYAVLHEPRFEEGAIAEREALMAFLEENPATRRELQFPLAKMGRFDYGGLYRFNYEAAPALLGHPVLLRVLAALPVVFAAVLIVNQSLGLLGLVLSLVINALVNYSMERNLELYLGAIGYLGSMLRSAEKMLGVLQKADLSPELHSCPILRDLEEGYHSFKGIRGALSGAARQARLNAEAGFIAEFTRIIFLTQVRSYDRATRMLAENKASFRQLYRGFGEVEVALSVLSLRMSLPHYTQPTFTDESVVSATGLYHPLLEEPVLNDASITRNALVSGSNASGKSTFIKAVAINGILAQTLNTCTASSFETRLALVVTSMAARDNIMAGESYFIAEIRSLKRLLAHARRRYCLCLVDEILKGTNTVERIAASAAILRQFDTLDSRCLVATHDIELTALLEGSFDNYHFEEQVSDEGVDFDYLIRSGPSRTRNAIRLLDTLGFDKAMVRDAEALVATWERTGHWPSTSDRT